MKANEVTCLLPPAPHIGTRQQCSILRHLEQERPAGGAAGRVWQELRKGGPRPRP